MTSDPQAQQIAPPGVQYRYSVKIESNSKGLLMPSVHVYTNHLSEAIGETTQLYQSVCSKLIAQGYRVAPEEAGADQRDSVTNPT